MIEKKLEFYLKVIYGDYDFNHPDKQKVIAKVINIRTIYQDCLNCSWFPFPLIPKSVNSFFEFIEVYEAYREQGKTEIDFVPIWDEYFVYGKQQLFDYCVLLDITTGDSKHLIETPTLEEILKNNINQLQDFTESEIEKFSIIKPTSIDNDDLNPTNISLITDFESDDEARAYVDRVHYLRQQIKGNAIIKHELKGIDENE